MCNHLQINQIYNTIDERIKSIDCDIDLFDLTKQQKLLFFKTLIIFIVENIKYQYPDIFNDFIKFLNIEFTEEIEIDAIKE